LHVTPVGGSIVEQRRHGLKLRLASAQGRLSEICVIEQSSHRFRIELVEDDRQARARESRHAVDAARTPTKEATILVNA